MPRRLLSGIAALAIALTTWLALVPAARSAPTDLADRIAALPGVASVEERPVAEGFRFFVIGFTQRVDHDDPGKGTFTQRLTLLHRSEDRPMIMYTSGYNVSTNPGRSEPARIVDGNQLSMEYRFFTPSRPSNPDWEEQLTIKQAATDQHVIIESFKQLYDQNWLTTGGSKGGMTATYHRRFFPDDVNGSVPYVAPNDVLDSRDEAYDSFLAGVGTDPACRDRLVGLQRRVLSDRDTWDARVAEASARDGLTYRIVGNRWQAIESGVIDLYFAFWQYTPQSECGSVPDPDTATDDQVWDFYEATSPLTGYADQNLERYVPYYFQAAYQLGSPKPYEDRIGDLLQYPGTNIARNFVPRSVRPNRFDWPAMRDIDRWVRTSSERMLYVYGGNDPWSAEPFTCGTSGASRECFRFFVDGGTHGSNIEQLPAAERDRAVALVRSWAGLDDTISARRSGLPPKIDGLDREPDYLEAPRAVPLR